MKTLKRCGSAVAAGLLIVAGAIAGFDPKWELRKLRRRKQGPGADEDREIVH